MMAQDFTTVVSKFQNRHPDREGSIYLFRSQPFDRERLCLRYYQSRHEGDQSITFCLSGLSRLFGQIETIRARG